MIISKVCFHPSGTLIATCSMDGSIKIFDIRTHKLIQHYENAHGMKNSDGLVTSNGKNSDGIMKSNSGSKGVNSVCFGGNNGEWLISTGSDGLIKIWDVKQGHLFYTLHGHKNGQTTTAIFSKTGDFFATGGSDSQVMVWKSNFDTVADGLENEFFGIYFLL
jgi:centriolar protein POC1